MIEEADSGSRVPSRATIKIDDYLDVSFGRFALNFGVADARCILAHR
jgi:hypothetical protein